jgi:hypothetical protein
MGEQAIPKEGRSRLAEVARSDAVSPAVANDCIVIFILSG